MKDPCSWRNNLFHPISGLELWSQVSRNWYILDSYFENFSWWVFHFPGYHKQTKMKYMGFSKNSFSEQIGFSLTGEAETAPYEFRFGMMIRYHKQTKETYMKFPWTVTVYRQIDYFTLISGPKQVSQISKTWYIIYLKIIILEFLHGNRVP